MQNPDKRFEKKSKIKKHYILQKKKEKDKLNLRKIKRQELQLRKNRGKKTVNKTDQSEEMEPCRNTTQNKLS